MNSSNSALLLEFFLARLEHLIVGRFFDAAGDELLTERFFLFIHTGRGTRCPSLPATFPFFFQFQCSLIFFRR